MSLNEKKNYILNELKKNGYRITTQRKVLIDIILEDECSLSLIHILISRT